jgi:hypothetical protein
MGHLVQGRQTGRQAGSRMTSFGVEPQPEESWHAANLGKQLCVHACMTPQVVISGVSLTFKLSGSSGCQHRLGSS